MDQDVSSLIAALGSPQETARAEAAEKLSQVDPHELRAAATVLVEACGDDSEAVREAAVGALEEMGPPDLGLLAALIELLGSEKADVAYWAATLIGRLESEGAAAVPALASAVQDSSHQNVRQRAVKALGNIGPGAAAAKDALTNAASGEDPRLARLAQRALEQIGG